MRKFNILLLVIILVLAQIFMSACFGGGSQSSSSSGGSESRADSSGNGDSFDSSIPSADSSIEKPDDPDDPVTDYSKLSSVAFVKEMGVGWNLGNAFENNLVGYPDSDYANSIVEELGFKNREMFCEVRNQQDIYRGAVTQQTVDTVYDKGFRTMRMPVSWSNHMAADGTINADWMNRIKEVVDYVFNKGDMFVILNIMDTPNIGAYYLDDAHYAKTKKLVTGVWTQVSKTFCDYDERLVFENLNEPLHSKLGWSMSPAVNTSEYKECIKNLNEYNQLYVDIVRGQGSENNKKRFLSVCGYGNIGYMTYSPEINAVAKFEMPDDEPIDRLLMNIHAYSPNGFSFGKDNVWDESKDDPNSGVKAMLNAFGKAYTEKGIGVLITEWGSVYKSDRAHESYRKKHATYFVENATKNGCCTVVWDNGTRSSNWSTEYFGLLNRHKASGLYDNMTNLSGVNYDNVSLWFSEGVIEAIFTGYFNGLSATPDFVSVVACRPE